MKLIKFVAFLFYRYYSEGKRPDTIPYFRTMCSMTLLGFMHLFQILIIFHKVDFMGISPSDSKGIKKIIIFFLTLPIYFLFTALIKKKELEKMREEYAYSWNKVFNWNVWLIVYIILSFSSIFILARWMK
jgi:hypothetical protein